MSEKMRSDALAHIPKFVSNTQIFKTLILKHSLKKRCSILQYLDCWWWLYNPHLLPRNIQKYSRSPIGSWVFSVVLCVCVCLGLCVRLCFVCLCLCVFVCVLVCLCFVCLCVCVCVLCVCVCVCLCSVCWVESFVITTTKTVARWHVCCAQTFWRTDNVWRIHLTYVKPVLLTNHNTRCTVHKILIYITKICYSWSDLVWILD